MSSLSTALEKICQQRGLTNLGLAQVLCLDPALASRISNDRKGLSHRLMGRMLVNLNDDEARSMIQAYFSDELQRIQEGRIENAEKLGVKLKTPEFPYAVRVVPTLKKAGTTRVKHKMPK